MLLAVFAQKVEFSLMTPWNVAANTFFLLITRYIDLSLHCSMLFLSFVTSQTVLSNEGPPPLIFAKTNKQKTRPMPLRNFLSRYKDNQDWLNLTVLTDWVASFGYLAAREATLPCWEIPEGLTAPGQHFSCWEIPGGAWAPLPLCSLWLWFRVLFDYHCTTEVAFSHRACSHIRQMKKLK